MGKITFTPIQQKLFDVITQHALLPKTFYFTGGTALSYLYLKHRQSEAFFRQKAKEIGSRAVEQ